MRMQEVEEPVTGLQDGQHLSLKDCGFNPEVLVRTEWDRGCVLCRRGIDNNSSASMGVSYLTAICITVEQVRLHRGASGEAVRNDAKLTRAGKLKHWHKVSQLWISNVIRECEVS